VTLPMTVQMSEPSADEVFKDQLVAMIPSLRAFARALCTNREMADDMAQDAMVRAWAARKSYTPDTNFRAWMFKILRNNYYTAFKKNARFSSWDPEAAERLLVARPTQEMAIHLNDVAAALAKLPTEQREVLMMVAAGGLSYEEAADAIGCAVGTVKSRVARGRAALARLIEGPPEAVHLTMPSKRTAVAPANN
jgi:RNA polymerase sigma-70 factor, ECF subfamily